MMCVVVCVVVGRLVVRKGGTGVGVGEEDDDDGGGERRR